MDELDGHAHDSRAAGAALGARFLLEGSLHQLGTSVRVSIRLSDRETGAHLWADTVDRDLAAGLFAAQDDIVGTVAATVADAGGVLVRSMGAAIRDLPLDGLGLDDLVLRYQLYTDQFSAADHAALYGAFEAMLAREPGAAKAWACLGMLVAAEMFFGLNPRPRPLERLRESVERGTVLDSSDSTRVDGHRDPGDVRTRPRRARGSSGARNRAQPASYAYTGCRRRAAGVLGGDRPRRVAGARWP